MDVTSRADRLRALLAREGCDGLLVTNLIDVRYLTGFSGSAGLLLVLADELVLVTDGRYGEQAAEQLRAASVPARLEVTGSAQREVLRAAAAGVARLGLQADHVTWAQQRSFAEEWFPRAELVATEGLVEELRAVKDPGELARLERAARIADEALAAVRGRLAEQPTEREVALELENEMRRLGADGPSFETIVASGPNGAKPHARPTHRVISEGDLVVLDFGALVDGYHSDMTRTIALGEPSPTQQRMLEVVTGAQQRGVEAVRAGVAASVVDAACREVIAAAGWADAFLHGTGHGVGLEIHERPRVAATSDATLAAANVVTVEPGVYLPEHGGVRVEDTVVVLEDGCRPLTHSPKHTGV
ncbi:MAG: Xaa-Pro peptidase family protein [Acidimicrobiales bacterium]